MKRYQFIDLLKYNFHIRKKPTVIQMPITSRCNSRCKTCNIWKTKESNDIDPEYLKDALKDDFFTEVRAVGINGGEFTLVPNFLEILKAVLVLPQISNIYLISNGLFPKKLFEYLELSKQICEKEGVKLHICISVDGYGTTHEYVRGIPNCFDKTSEVLNELYTHKDKYCSSFSIGCTISIHNIDTIKCTYNYLKETYDDVYVEYHFAVPNKRIHTFDCAEYYILNDEQKRLQGVEFFHELYRNAKTEFEKVQYFSNYYFLKTKGTFRASKCDYTNRDVTIDEKLDLSLCATASDIIGNLKEHTASELISSNRAKAVWNDISGYCATCGHYLENSLTIKGRIAFIQEEMKARYALDYYSIGINKTNYRKCMDIVKFMLRLSKSYLRYIYIYIWKLQ